MDPCLRFDRVSKRYQLGRALPSLRSMLSDLRNRHDVQYHTALENVTFEVGNGEALGIIGPNGAGKTTILKILAGVTRPTTGYVHVRGRLSALIELGAGFHPDLTGRENVFLNGTILGMRRHEIKARFDRIVDFAGVDEYIDTPVKRYSSGMYARLGFAIAAHIDPQILLVDEVLAVGDFAFQTKCQARMDELKRNGTALLLVSHNMETVRRVCDRGMVMYGGQAVFQGSADEAVIAYSDAIRQAARQKKMTVPGEEGLSQRVMTFDAEIDNVVLLDAGGRTTAILRSDSEAIVAIGVHFNSAVENPIFAFTVRNLGGQAIYNITTKWLGIRTPCFSAGDRCRVEFSLRLPLLDGAYELGVDAAAGDLSHYYDRLERAMTFMIAGASPAQGIVDLQAKVTFHPIVAREAAEHAAVTSTKTYSLDGPLR